MRRVGERARAEGGEIDNSQLSRYEKGICYPSFEKLRVLASVFNVSIQSFSDMVDLDSIEPVDRSETDAGALIERGNDALRAGDNGLSFSCYERALELLGEQPASEEVQAEMARTRIHQAAALTRLGRLSLAEQELRKALSDEDALTPTQTVQALLALSNVQADVGDRMLAQMSARQALETAQENENNDNGFDRLAAMSLHCLGRIQADRLRWTEAIRSFLDAAKAYEGCNETYEMLRVRINVGSCYIAVGKYRQGGRLLQAALRQARSGEYRRLEAQCWSGLGEAFYRQGEHERAQRCLRESTALASFNEEEQPDLMFHNVFYQWRIAREGDNPSREKLAFGRLKALRSKLERTFPEVREFDGFVKRGKT